MLFKLPILQQIKAGKVTTAYRKWLRPAIKAGSTLMTSVGVLYVNSVEEIEYDSITDNDIIKAGLTDRKQLDKELSFNEQGNIYRITFELQCDDPRLALREKSITKRELEEIQAKLAKLDKAGKYGAWTIQVLKMVSQHPGKHAAFFCDKMGVPKEWFKLNIRKLKNLGLTISLVDGYIISPRGKELLQKIER